MGITSADKKFASQAERGNLRALGTLLRRLVDYLDPGERIVNLTAATLSLSIALHDGKTVTVNKADGSTITLPDATGSGARFRVFCGTTITSNSLKVQVANADDVMTGLAIFAQDAADTAVAFEAGATADTISLNGSTTGGIKGDVIELEDVANNLWSVKVIGAGTGTEATPFSAAVS